MDATALEPRHDLRLAYRCNGGSPSIHQVAHALGVALNVAEKDCFPHPWGPISFMVRSEAASVRHDVVPELNVADTKTLVSALALVDAVKAHPFWLVAATTQRSTLDAPIHTRLCPRGRCCTSRNS